jgi:hypothetical protein
MECDDRLQTMLTANDPPYDEATMAKGRMAATKLEQMFFEKAPDQETYERKISQKIESMSAQIVKARAKRAMEAQGLKMAEAPTKPAAAAAEKKVEESREASADATTSGGEVDYSPGKNYFSTLPAQVQKQMRGDVLKKWLDTNAKTSQIAREFLKAKTPKDKKALYEEKLKPHLDVWLFKQMTAQMEKKRQRESVSINPELKGFVKDLLAEEGAPAAKRRATEVVEPSAEYWGKVHELNQTYHAQLSRAFKWVQAYQTSGSKLGPVRQKFVDLLSNIIMPAIEQTPARRDPNIPADMDHLLKVENAIKKALSKYEATEKAKQEQQRLQTMTSTQRAIASLTDAHGGSVKVEARSTIADACRELLGGLGADDDVAAALYESDEDDDEVDVNFPVDLLKDFWSDKEQVLPAGDPETWTIQNGKDVIAVAFKGDGVNSARAAAVSEY